MDQLLNKLLFSNAGLAATILRFPIGIILSAHSSQKLFAWFSPKKTGYYMDSIGLHLGYLLEFGAVLNFLAGLG